MLFCPVFAFFECFLACFRHFHAVPRPLCAAKFGQLHGFFHRFKRLGFVIPTEVRVNVARRLDVRVIQIHLHLLERNLLLVHQRGACVSKIMEATMLKTALFQNPREYRFDVARSYDDSAPWYCAGTAAGGRFCKKFSLTRA